MTYYTSHTPASADTASLPSRGKMMADGIELAPVTPVIDNRGQRSTLDGTLISPQRRAPQSAIVDITPRAIVFITHHDKVTVSLTPEQVVSLQQSLKQYPHASITLNVVNTPPTLKMVVPTHNDQSAQTNAIASDVKQLFSSQSQHYANFISTALKAAVANQGSVQSPLASVQIKNLEGHHSQLVALTLRLPNIDANYRLHHMTASLQEYASNLSANGEIVIHPKKIDAVDVIAIQQPPQTKSLSTHKLQLSVVHQAQIFSLDISKVLQQSPLLLSQLLPNTIKAPLQVPIENDLLTKLISQPDQSLEQLNRSLDNPRNRNGHQQPFLGTFDNLHSSSPSLTLSSKMGGTNIHFNSISPTSFVVKAIITLGSHSITSHVSDNNNYQYAPSSTSPHKLDALQKIVDTAVLRLQQQPHSQNNKHAENIQNFKQQLMTTLLTLPQFSKAVSSDTLLTNNLAQTLTLLPNSLKNSASTLSVLNDAKSLNTDSMVHLVARQIAQQIHSQLDQEVSSHSHSNETNQPLIKRDLSELASESLLTSHAVQSSHHLMQPGSTSTLLSGLVNLVQIALARRLQSSSHKNHSDIAATLISSLNKLTQNKPGQQQQLPKLIDEIAFEAPNTLSHFFKKHALNALKIPDMVSNNSQPMYWTIPNLLLPQASDIEVLVSKINDEKKQSKPEQAKNAQSGWQLLLRFDIDNVGSMLSRVKYANNELDINLYGDSPELVKRITQYLPYLHTPLSNAGLIINKSQVNLGKIPTSLAKIETCHVNFEI